MGWHKILLSAAKQHVLWLVLVFSCNHANNSYETSPAKPRTVDATSSASTSDVDVSITGPANPVANDVYTNAATQAQVLSSGFSSVAAALAASAAGGGASSAALTLAGTVIIPNVPSQTVIAGAVALDCYRGANIALRPQPGGSATITWPESAVSTSVFSASKNDPSLSSSMYVEPALLVYPESNPSSVLGLAVPFHISSMAEVIAVDTRTLFIALNNPAQTLITNKTTNEEHRFWVAKSPLQSQSSALISCAPSSGDLAKGNSNNADGSWARIDFTDDNQADGLNLLLRFARSATYSLQFLPKVKGVLQSTPRVLSRSSSATGSRLVQWSLSDKSLSEVSNAAFARSKKITSTLNESDQIVDAEATVKSDTAAREEIRASAPLQVTEYRNKTGKLLLQRIESGALYKTANATNSDEKENWFVAIEFASMVFDLVKSSEPCIPLSGKATVTVFNYEGGSQIGQRTITFSATANTGKSGLLDPLITVSGDDSSSTKAKWLLLAMNRACDFRV
jgi:hypothetical protein